MGLPLKYFETAFSISEKINLHVVKFESLIRIIDLSTENLNSDFFNYSKLNEFLNKHKIFNKYAKVFPTIFMPHEDLTFRKFQEVSS